MFKSPQNMKVAGGLPVLWIHFTKTDSGRKLTVRVSLADTDDDDHRKTVSKKTPQ